MCQVELHLSRRQLPRVTGEMEQGLGDRRGKHNWQQLAGNALPPPTSTPCSHTSPCPAGAMGLGMVHPLGKTTTTQNGVKKARFYLQVNTQIPGLLEMLHRDEKYRSPKSLALQNRLCCHPSHPQPSQCWRIPEKSDPALPLPTAAAKASPWKLLPAFHPCSLGPQQEQLYLFPQVLSGTQGLKGSSAQPPALRLTDLITGEGCSTSHRSESWAATWGKC